MDLPLHVRYGDDTDIEITLPNGVTECVQLSHLEGNHYRLESSCMFGEPTVFYGDVIELEPTSEACGLFRRIVRKSGLVVVQRIIPHRIAESPLLPSLLGRVMELGGNWERFLGGVPACSSAAGMQLTSTVN